MDNKRIDLSIIDNYIDDREFRNYVASVLDAKGFKRLKIDDVGLRDESDENDNEMVATLDGISYTIHTFLNRNITVTDVDDAVLDIDKENVESAILVTNLELGEEIKEYAIRKGAQIWDREVFDK